MNKILEYFEKEADKFEARREKFIDWIISRSILKKYFNSKNFKNSLILDAGCGAGFWLRYFSKKKALVIALDFSLKMLKTAKTNVKSKKVKFVRADIRKLPFGSNTFDYVICLGQTLSQINPFKKALREMVRVTKRGGKIIIEVDGRYGKALSLLFNGDIFSSFKVLISGTGYDPFKTHAFTVHELVKVLKKLRCDIKDVFSTSAINEFIPKLMKLMERKAITRKILEKEFKYRKFLAFIASRFCVVCEKL